MQIAETIFLGVCFFYEFMNMFVVPQYFLSPNPEIIIASQSFILASEILISGFIEPPSITVAVSVDSASTVIFAPAASKSYFGTNTLHP